MKLTHITNGKENENLINNINKNIISILENEHENKCLR